MIDKTKPLVSVIIPIYNVDEYLDKCIDSVINQTYGNLEIILVDDGASDLSGKIGDEYILKDSRIKLIHKTNGGLSDARNAGLDIATGEYITFIDSDDWYDINAMSVLISLIFKYNAELSCMRNISITSTDFKYENRIFNHVDEVITEETLVRKICNKEYSTSVCNKLFKSTLLQNIRFKNGSYNEDFLFIGEILMNNIKIAITNFIGYNYYNRQNSITKNKETIIEAVFNSIQNSIYLKNKSSNIKKEYEKYYAQIALYQARTLLIIIPKDYICYNSKYIKEIKNCIKDCKKYIIKSKLKIADKIILILANINPVFVAKILHLIKTY